jgi:hypothetical protein
MVRDSLLAASGSSFGSGYNKSGEYFKADLSSDFEGPGHSPTEREQVTVRLGVRMVEKLGSQSVAFLASSCVGVYGLAFCEGLLLCKNPAGSILFAARYGFENIFPSITHSTRSASDICVAMGYDAKAMLIGATESQKYASQRLRSHAFQTTRCILMGMVGVAAAVRIIDLESEAVDEYKINVQNGREPILKGVKERVIRFIGEESDVTDLSMRLHGQHIIPIVEHAEIAHGISADYQELIEHFTGTTNDKRDNKNKINRQPTNQPKPSPVRSYYSALVRLCNCPNL